MNFVGTYLNLKEVTCGRWLVTSVRRTGGQARLGPLHGGSK
jgi:hypothetical protein